MLPPTLDLPGSMPAMSNVIVIGAGIAGIQAALDIAGHGIHVHLIECEPTIGGHMAQLDKTFPTNDCSMCILSPKMVDVARNPYITIHTCTEVQTIEGEAGHFTVTLKKHPRNVDESACTGCGDCILVCPVEVYNRFDAGIGVRKAIYKPHPQAVPDIVMKDPDHCIECGLCYDVCGPDAIRRKEEAKVFTIPAASILITTGYTVFDACNKSQFGHLTLPDVITSLELERMINASGPTGGKILRLSDGNKPESIVFIQCVGSRDMSIGRPSCSCVCCMQAIKNAMLIKEKNPTMDITICYMDLRAYGKGYEEYLERAKALGIRFLRGMPSDVIADRNGMILQVENSETSEVQVLHPDLVVLSIGISPADKTAELAEKFGILREETGFVKPVNDAVDTVATLRPGIYIAGTTMAPKDIPDCVASAGSAAMRAYIDAMRTRSP
jgi:heterodisulfide reductase subunit A2